MTVSLNKIRWMLRLLGWIKIPLIGYVRPRLVNLDDNVAVVKIKLRRRTRNHLHSMYFGALAIGAPPAVNREGMACNIIAMPRIKL